MTTFAAFVVGGLQSTTKMTLSLIRRFIILRLKTSVLFYVILPADKILLRRHCFTKPGLHVLYKYLFLWTTWISSWFLLRNLFPQRFKICVAYESEEETVETVMSFHCRNRAPLTYNHFLTPIGALFFQIPDECSLSVYHGKSDDMKLQLKATNLISLNNNNEILRNQEMVREEN